MDSQGSVKEWQQVCVQKDKQIEKLLKEVDHWKKCTESEQKIAGQLQKKVQRMDVAINEMERMSESLKTELTFEKETDFEDLGWKQVLVSEFSILKKYLKILKG